MTTNNKRTLSWNRLPDLASFNALLLAGLLVTTGCSSLTSPINGVPARRLPQQFFAPPKNNLVPIDISLLSQEAPRSYILDSGDILGVYIEGVLPFNAPDVTPTLPPVHFPDAESTLPPSLGFPIAVGEDGTVSLPLVEPIDVRGRTVDQVRELVRRAYIEQEILKEEKARPVVTLIKERTYNVIVVRQDQATSQNSINSGSQQFTLGQDQSAAGNIVKLPAYQNDVLHALMKTGGLPGVNAKNEVKILRASQADKRARAEMVARFYQEIECQKKINPCICPPPPPEDSTAIRIPLRLPPGVIPNIQPRDVLLKDGDILYIESRDTEVFYTGGLLPGGEHPIPRDYDLDVIGAMAIAGTGLGSQGASGGGGGGGIAGGAAGVGGVPPGKLFVLRKTPCNGQVAIEVDLTKAINDPRERPLVQAGDILILQYKCEEELLNFGLGTFFTFGIQELLRN